MKRIWKYISKSNGYFVSNLGEVRNSRVISWNKLCRCYSVRSSQILKPTYSFGYQYVGIQYLNGVIKRERVHRLVAQAFIPNPNGYPYVNHKNGRKADNRVENLEWCNGSQNAIHAYSNGLIDLDKFRSIRSSQATPYLIETTSGEIIKFGTQKALLKFLNVGKTVFKSKRYQEFLLKSGVICKRISKEEYFALEGSTTIPLEV